MQNNIESEYLYISSDGSSKDVRTLDTQYLINALAKSLRNMFESTEFETRKKYTNNVTHIYEELGRRDVKQWQELAEKWNS